MSSAAPPSADNVKADKASKRAKKTKKAKKVKKDKYTASSSKKRKRVATLDGAQSHMLGEKRARESAASVTPADIGRHYTVSVAIPSSIIGNAQSEELKTYLAGQVARHAAVFCVDEIVVFDDGSLADGGNGDGHGSDAVDGGLTRKGARTSAFLARVLQYLETPQYLRKAFFPIHPDLRLAGLLNPLDSPHHMRYDEFTTYREGVTLQRPSKKNRGSWVKVGTIREVQVDRKLEPGVRVTVRFDRKAAEDAAGGAGTADPGKAARGVLVSPAEPRERLGLYWGYTVRIAASLSAVLTESPHEGGYDLTVGTSERGEHLWPRGVASKPLLPPFKHLMVVFGGLPGLEEAFRRDTQLAATVAEVKDLFDLWLNVCPEQGSRTIRTEEAMLIAMAALGPHIKTATSK